MLDSDMFARYVDEMTRLTESLEECVRALGEHQGGERRTHILRDVARLARAASDVSTVFEMRDIASLAAGVAELAAVRLGDSDPRPVELPGVVDSLSYVRWRLSHMAESESPPSLDESSRILVTALEAGLAIGRASATDLLAGDHHFSSANLDSLNELTPQERELVHSFETADLKPRDTDADARMMAQVMPMPVSAGRHPVGMVTPEELDVIPVEMKRLFVSETEGDLQTLSELIASFPRTPDKPKALSAMARIAHKIKGSAATLGFPAFTEVAISMGDVIRSAQRGTMRVDDALETTLARFLQLFDACLAAAATLGQPPDHVVAEAVRLSAEVSGAPSAQVITTSPQTAGTHVSRPSETRDIIERETLLQVDASRLETFMSHLSALAINRGSIALARSEVARAQTEMNGALARLREKSAQVTDLYPRGLRETSNPGGLGRLPLRIPAGDSQSTEPESGISGPLREIWDRVDTDMSTEVDIAMRSLPEIVADVEALNATLSRALVQIGQLTEAQEILIRNMQQDATRMRLAPFVELVPRLEVLANATASTVGKKVRFTIEGEMTELDRTLMRHLTEPIGQLVRNAIVHGIEPAEERLEEGKPEIGSVWVKAYYAGSEVVIEVGDDGQGVNAHALVALAVSIGMLDAESASRLTEDESLNLMFRPGISTVGEASVLAGTGLGLDDVATVIRGLKGDIVVESHVQTGTIFRIHVPMTLSVLSTLEVMVADQAFTVPFSSVIAIVDASADMLTPAQGATAFVDGLTPREWRLTLSPRMDATENPTLDMSGEMVEAGIPAFSLSAALGFAAHAYERFPAIIVEHRGARVALLAQAVGEVRDTLVRPLQAHLRRRVLRGVTIRPDDGAIALLLDVSELVEQRLSGQKLVARSLPAPRTPVRPLSRVLIVDDSLTIRRTLDQMLTSAGFETTLARDGYEALEMMEAHAPRVVILDVEMPRLSGFELLRIIRNSSRYEQVRVAMLTSRAGANSEQQAKVLGADAYLVKPCSQDNLISTVRSLLTNSEPS